MGLAARVLSWVRKAPDVIADGAMTSGPIGWIRADDGGLTRCRLREARDYKVFLGGVPHEHVDTASDGSWIYEARKY